METQTLYEIIGYVASIGGDFAHHALRAAPATRQPDRRAVFTIYGVLIHAYPVAVLNALIVLIDLYYLIEMARARAYFALLEVTAESKYLPAFLRFHAQGIQQFFPTSTTRPTRPMSFCSCCGTWCRWVSLSRRPVSQAR
ncbi:hypothetical protein [Candidatus Amarolinea dominans]|uniref:hypothetical protein n=1 Tax=Candidatus Amarolinea dominans TaxID=3140696 RepID=UPI0031CC6347